MNTGQSASRTPKLLREFDRDVRRVEHVFTDRYGKAAAQTTIAEARQEFANLIPNLPNIGEKQPFTQFLVFTAWLLAMYRVLQRRGATIEEVGRLVYQVSEAFIQRYPRPLRRLLGSVRFSRRSLERLEKRAAESQERLYPGDYVFRFVPGNGEEFDYGIDYVECGTCKFLQANGAPELSPYLCATDRLYSETFGWGLARTTTLAEGAPRCDFRYTKGRPTRVAVPDPLLPLVQK